MGQKGKVRQSEYMIKDTHRHSALRESSTLIHEKGMRMENHH